MAEPVEVMARLQAIEEDLAERQETWERAALDVARLKRDFEKRHAEALVAQDPELKVDERKARALLALAADGIYGEYREAEASYEAHKAAIAVLEKRASIGQSILRALTQEGFRANVPQPAWSGS